jgi:hypothetical protein
VTLLAFPVGSDFVLGPVAAATHQPVLAAPANRAVPYFGFLAHVKISVAPLF